jgi:hypothetical protein
MIRRGSGGGERIKMVERGLQNLTDATPCLACLLADSDLWTTGEEGSRDDTPCRDSPSLTCLPILHYKTVKNKQTHKDCPDVSTGERGEGAKKDGFWIIKVDVRREGCGVWVGQCGVVAWDGIGGWCRQ